MPCTIAILSDLHYTTTPDRPERRGEWAHVLLTRAVHRLNRFIQPDVVLLLGDCIESPDSPEAVDLLRELRGIMDLLDCPWIALPGNHDPAPERFYECFPRPPEQLDVAGTRILPFIDPVEAEYNARRTPTDLDRMRAARQDGFAGPVVSAQHVSVFPAFLQPRLGYGYTNVDEVLRAANAGGVDLCVGGHSHKGTGVVRHGRTAYLSVDPLFEYPFPYTLVTVDDAPSTPRIESYSESLALPAEYNLVDTHSHTQFAYCGKNVHTEHSPTVAELVGLKTLAFTEHSGHLYFSLREYADSRFGDDWAARALPEHARMHDYLRLAGAKQSDALIVGVEVDADFEGNQVLHPHHAEQMELVVGAVHVLREGKQSSPDPEAFTREFKQVTERLCHTGIDVLAHPFRIFRRSRLSPDPALYAWLAQLLKRTEVVAEINFHTNNPAVAFVQACLELQVPLTFGSDAHQLYEIGEFYPHLALLRQAGVTGDPGDMLWAPCRRFATLH